jgi:hypothetical protein
MKRELAVLLSSNEFPAAAVAELESLASKNERLSQMVAQAIVANEATPIYDTVAADLVQTQVQ